MTKLVVHGAKLKCSQGTSSATLAVLPTSRTEGESHNAATVQDYVPVVNIASFGMCQTQANPQVAAATAAAQGVLTPQPCIPVTTAAWSPGASSVTIDGKAALTDDSKCNCQWSGSIEVTDAGNGAIEIG